MRRSAPRSLALLASLLAGALPPLLPGAASAQGDPRVLRVVPSADVAELDPTRGPNLIARIYAQMVFDTLFALDSQLVPRPMMVERHSVSADGLTYDFTLRDGLRFHDGKPVTTRDVVASIDRWMSGTSIGAQLKSRVAAMAVADDRRFTLTLNQPFGLVEFMLAGPGAPIAAIMPEADARREATVPLTRPIGSGPFRYVAGQRQEGNRVVFERNPDYPARSEPTDGLAGARVVKLDRVEWTIMPDPTTAANALATGEVDLWESVNPDMIAFLRQRRLTVRRTNTLPSVAFIRPNFQAPPFNDVRARQALALLVDQAEMMPAVNGEGAAWSKCFSFSICGSAYGTEVGSEPFRTPDPARARQLLAEAGYRGETIVLLGTPTLAPINAMTQVLARRLEDIGVKVDVQLTDFPTMLQRINAKDRAPQAGGYNLFAYYAVGSSWFHPLMNVPLDLSCGGRNWPGFPCDEQGEALRQRFLAAGDDASRRTAFEAFQKRLWEFIPYVPAGQFDVVHAWRDNVRGVLDSYFLAYWNIEKR
ncbi:ABC transporter substrate-binding protein [Roseomonas sp. OT10]|uniref:ABC transporter substrate-binding protein n=1 Tax=Roseomonas cutis TaxID=2897332 RepID=UPI001E5FF739|nr:ABC transporter substrate-binding protein [Roseomonas sp. OT10]UFN47562.1 ABC transporter substrate-binding protein [Roseomonas sp. OT10]